MTEHTRSHNSKTKLKNIGTGPYLAKIVSHLDPSFMGSLEVTLLRIGGNIVGDDTQTYIVKCASPFFGYTAYEFMGANSAANGSSTTLEAYNDTQKSYGMWMIPPDVGVTVLVLFVNGDPGQGYWVGCIPSNFSNNMVPAIAGSTQVDYSTADKQKFNTSQPLPVAEINRRLNTKLDQQVDPNKIKKPLHPIAERFLEQGLLEDDTRGVTNSSARREVPSMVFGISTPGPLDKRPSAKRGRVGTIQNSINSYVSRLGGTQLVMDDGQDRFVRATPASSGPVKYIDLLLGTDAATGEKTNEKGDPTLPYNEYFRVRTRTGHQLLMHNTEDLIYIGNSRGTTWIELTSNGKIDIYAQDSISIHSENDLNIRADRDINMEAGRNINLKAENRLHTESINDTEIIVGANGFITTTNNLDINTGKENKFTAGASTDLNSGTSNKFTAGTSTDIRSLNGNHTETAPMIHMNGPVASIAESAEIKLPLVTHPYIKVDPNFGWAVKYQDVSGTPPKSIMKRIPMHEPWPLHENFLPTFLKPQDTDREIE